MQCPASAIVSAARTTRSAPVLHIRISTVPCVGTAQYPCLSRSSCIQKQIISIAAVQVISQAPYLWQSQFQSVGLRHTHGD